MLIFLAGPSFSEVDKRFNRSLTTELEYIIVDEGTLSRKSTEVITVWI